ncbi:MAG: hypothetical protein N2691_04930 [Patescibacteria group bacterium]|nr:hypothetical protein [Patescibacteria group bacterium]
MPAKKSDIVQRFHAFRRDILEKKPPHRQMRAEVQMMRFKVRPVSGDVSVLNFQNEKFLEALWSLGKLDEFFHQVVGELKKTDKHIFYKLFDGLYREYQRQLNQIGIRDGATPGENKTFEVEIFREKPRSDN